MLIKKTAKVTSIFQSADKQINKFKEKTGLKCINKCGECCLKNNIEATVLEFMPAALYIVNNSEFENIYSKLNNNFDKPICIFYNPFTSDNGYCSIYEYRGLICRLFGFSANYNKNGIPNMITCRQIKQNLSFNNVYSFKKYIPIISEYYLKLYLVDFNLSRERLPINQAIKKALDIVMLYYEYKKPRKTG